ncbi:hemicentin-2-like [Eriocheir sinensis]|uniref:hemicentin-2-like n=1 Tax=Eriocheir sinensis TaxID=95602 RepID=UPI0021C6FD4B|nr:hemicentin-2-like [Eriocheir sinensis]
MFRNSYNGPSSSSSSSSSSFLLLLLLSFPLLIALVLFHPREALGETLPMTPAAASHTPLIRRSHQGTEGRQQDRQGGEEDGEEQDGEAKWGGRPHPYFSQTPTNLTVISGQTAFLPCRVHMLGERSVTWMRARDLHILTVGFITYTADQRFQVLHSPRTDDWTLQIQTSQPRDAGRYTCQVNSDPKIVRDVYLSVTDKRFLDGRLYKMPPTAGEKDPQFGTHIVGGATRVLQAGSSLVLECVVTHTGAPPPAVIWLRNDLPLLFDSPRGGVSLQVEKSQEHTTSRLSLAAVRDQDSANYTCLPVNSTAAASVAVHVNSADELRAAVQQGGLSCAPPPPTAAPHHHELLSLLRMVMMVAMVVMVTSWTLWLS